MPRKIDLMEAAGHSFAAASDYMNGWNDAVDTMPRWISVEERLPPNYVSVLGYMTDAGEFPPVRECYTVGKVFFFPPLLEKHPVSHWMPLPEPPKEETPDANL